MDPDPYKKTCSCFCDCGMLFYSFVLLFCSRKKVYVIGTGIIPGITPLPESHRKLGKPVRCSESTG